MFSYAKELITGKSPLTVPYETIGLNRLPTYGIAGAQYPPAGWIPYINFSVDDSSFKINLPFPIKMFGITYNDLHVGTNGYITFGSGSAVYQNLNQFNPPLNKIHFGAGDNSLQRLSYYSNGNYLRFRFEGNGTFVGTPGNPRIVAEFTFFNPLKVKDNKMMVEMLIGKHNRLPGAAMIADRFGNYLPYNLSENTSYVFLGDTNGQNWTITKNSHVIGVDY